MPTTRNTGFHFRDSEIKDLIEAVFPDQNPNAIAKSILRHYFEQGAHMQRCPVCNKPFKDCRSLRKFIV